MGVMVNYDGLCTEVAQTNTCLQNCAETAERCINALTSYCSESSLHGAAYDNSKKYFSNTYVPILKQIILICKEMEAQNNQILSSFSSNVPTTHGFLADTDVLEAEIERLKRENDYYRRQINDYSNSFNILSSLYNNIGLIIYYRGCILANDRCIRAYQKVIDGLYAFEGSCAGIFDESVALTKQMSDAISLLGGTFSSDTSRLTIPESFISIFEKLKKDKLINKDGSLNCDELSNLISINKELTEAELRAIASVMYPTQKELPVNLNYDNLKKKFLQDMASADYAVVTDTQKAVLVTIYEHEHSEHAKAINRFFNNIPADTTAHKYSDDIRNIKFITYTADEPYRSFYLGIIGDIKVNDWQYEDGSQHYSPSKKALYLDLTDDSTTITGGEGKNDYRGAYVTFFHECFHAIDDAMVADSATIIEDATRQNNDRLYHIAKSDVESIIMTEIQNADISGELADRYDSILEEIMSWDSSGFSPGTPEAIIYTEVKNNINADIGSVGYKANGVSDVYEGFTNGSIGGLTGGHIRSSPTYWFDAKGNTRYSQTSELWAHYGGRVMTGDPVALQKFEEYFPEASKEMYAMIVNYGAN